MSEERLSAEELRALESWAPPNAPADLAVRAVRRYQGRRWRFRAAAAVVAVLAASGLIAASGGGDSGDLIASERTELALASATAEAEPGAHLVGFDGTHDLLTLQHRARGREGFALGAVLAAEWLDRQEERGWHTFESVLGEILTEGGNREL